jgi:predicted Fe-Mo cluster-binding NifX family protein
MNSEDIDMKIAAVTDDGKTLSSHFGMAPLYRVLTVENGQVVDDQLIDKPHHARHPDHHSGQHNHQDFFTPIQGCDVLIAGGMGGPAYQHAQDAGFDMIMTGGEIDAAVSAYLRGELVSDARRIHHH